MGDLEEHAAPEGRPLSAAETERLLRRIRAGDAAARAELIRGHLRLVWSVVRRFAGRSAEEEDLFQVGCIGLIKAADRFDLERGLQFSTYAVPLIIGEIRRFLRDDGAMRVSRRLQEEALALYRAREELLCRLEREPVFSELAAAAGLSEEEAALALAAEQPGHSLSEALFSRDGSLIRLEERLAAPEPEHALELLAIRSAMGGLPERLQRLVQLRFFEDRTQAETATLLGVSQVQVSRLEKKCLLLLRELLGEA